MTDLLPAGRYELVLHVIKTCRSKGKVWWLVDATDRASGYRSSFVVFGVPALTKLNRMANMKLGPNGQYLPNPERRYSGQASVELSFDPKQAHNRMKDCYTPREPSDNPTGVLIPLAADPLGRGDVRSAALDFGMA